jgi:hypothetical protein
MIRSKIVTTTSKCMYLYTYYTFATGLVEFEKRLTMQYEYPKTFFFNFNF